MNISIWHLSLSLLSTSAAFEKKSASFCDIYSCRSFSTFVSVSSLNLTKSFFANYLDTPVVVSSDITGYRNTCYVVLAGSISCSIYYATFYNCISKSFSGAITIGYNGQIDSCTMLEVHIINCSSLIPSAMIASGGIYVCSNTLSLSRVCGIACMAQGCYFGRLSLENTFVSNNTLITQSASLGSDQSKVLAVLSHTACIRSLNFTGNKIQFTKSYGIAIQYNDDLSQYFSDMSNNSLLFLYTFSCFLPIPSPSEFSYCNVYKNIMDFGYIMKPEASCEFIYISSFSNQGSFLSDISPNIWVYLIHFYSDEIPFESRMKVKSNEAFFLVVSSQSNNLFGLLQQMCQIITSQSNASSEKGGSIALPLILSGLALVSITVGVTLFYFIRTSRRDKEVRAKLAFNLQVVNEFG